jgi:hypothetical protein
VAPTLEVGRLGGSKPSRGRETPKAERTGAGIPGTVDLRARVAVGAQNPMRVAGAAQDSGGDLPVYPEGESKPMEVSGAPAPDSWAPENRVAVETAWREAVNRIAANGAR